MEGMASVVGPSKARAFFKAMGRVVRAVLFGGYRVYDAMVLPEFAPVEYPEDNLSESMNFKKSTLEMEKLLLYLTCALEKGRALSAENKILKKRIRTLLRKSGRLNIRLNVKWNSSVRKYQMALSDSGKLLATATTQVDEGNQTELNSTSFAMVDAATQFEDVNGRNLLGKGFSSMETHPSDGGCKSLCKDFAKPSKIPVANFRTSPSHPARKVCSNKRGASLSDESCGEEVNAKRRSTSLCTTEPLRCQCGPPEEEATTGNLLYFPSLMATIVAKTAERVKSNLDVSWPSLYENSCVDQQFNELFGEGEDMMPLMVSLSGIHHCSRRIFQRISGLVDSKGNSLLHLVAKNDKYGMLPIILEHYPNSVDTRNAEGETPLMVAAASGSATAVRRLLQAGAAPNAQDRAGRTALMGAVSGGHERVVRLLLLQRGISIFIKDADGVSAVDLAIRSDSAHIQCCFLMNSQMYT